MRDAIEGLAFAVAGFIQQPAGTDDVALEIKMFGYFGARFAQSVSAGLVKFIAMR